MTPANLPQRSQSVAIGIVGKIMGQEPYKSARRVFWIIDNWTTALLIEVRRPSTAYKSIRGCIEGRVR
jgi:hypothetical protein